MSLENIIKNFYFEEVAEEELQQQGPAADNKK